MNMTVPERNPDDSHSAIERGAVTVPLAQAAPRMSGSYGITATDAAGHMRKLDEIEGELIRMAIERYHGRMAEVARRLGIGRSTLYRKLKDLGLEQPAEATEAPADEEAESFRAAG
jgi:DNA-binding NtrC family response regulator